MHQLSMTLPAQAPCQSTDSLQHSLQLPRAAKKKQPSQGAECQDANQPIVHGDVACVPVLESSTAQVWTGRKLALRMRLMRFSIAAFKPLGPLSHRQGIRLMGFGDQGMNGHEWHTLSLHHDIVPSTNARNMRECLPPNLASTHLPDEPHGW